MPLQSAKQAFKEFGKGELHSGKGGPIVKDKKQATAIALSVERRKKSRPRAKDQLKAFGKFDTDKDAM